MANEGSRRQQADAPAQLSSGEHPAPRHRMQGQRRGHAGVVGDVDQAAIEGISHYPALGIPHYKV
jgi:hypothetical protein